MTSTKSAECFECGRIRPINMMYKVELYATPWENKSRTEYFCKVKPNFHDYANDCLELLEDHNWRDFRYFTCNICDRKICEQNPRNGWHIQYRVLDNEQVCLQCYEKHIIENGIDRQKFEEGRLPGMFFSGDNHEVLDAGYTVDIYNKYIARNSDIKVVCQQAIELIDLGKDRKSVV